MTGPTDLAASVRQRLLNQAQRRGIDPNLLWTRFATERLLYRLAHSPHAEDFVLKGAMLFLTWTEDLLRPTLDLDLQGHGEDSVERLERVFRDLCSLRTVPSVADALVFHADSVRAAPIRQDQEYQGKRITLRATLGTIRIPLQVDVGFGDVVTPRPERVTFPALLEFPAPVLRGITRETVIAEKTQACVSLGIANSRMKDFFDLHQLSRRFAFAGADLAAAIAATFARRRTALPVTVPVALSPVFATDRAKRMQWEAFLRKGRLGEQGFDAVLAELRAFLMPVIAHAAGRGADPGSWQLGGPWR